MKRKCVYAISKGENKNEKSIMELKELNKKKKKSIYSTTSGYLTCLKYLSIQGNKISVTAAGFAREKKNPPASFFMSNLDLAHSMCVASLLLISLESLKPQLPLPMQT